VNVHLVIELSFFDTEKWSFDYKIHYVGYIYEYKQYNLDDWVAE
jgi:hypothetical protein